MVGDYTEKGYVLAKGVLYLRLDTYLQAAIIEHTK
jgi:hypothetical protein